MESGKEPSPSNSYVYHSASDRIVFAFPSKDKEVEFWARFRKLGYYTLKHLCDLADELGVPYETTKLNSPRGMATSKPTRQERKLKAAATLKDMRRPRQTKNSANGQRQHGKKGGRPQGRVENGIKSREKTLSGADFIRF